MFGPYLGLSGGLAQVDMKVSASMFNCSPVQASTNQLYGMPLLDRYNVSGDYQDGTMEGGVDYSNVPAGRAYQDCVIRGIGELKNNLAIVPVDVYQKSGNFFAGGHLGTFIRFGGEPKSMGLMVNLNIMAMLPNQSLVVEPSLGFVYGL
jgi:hypothetical protein